MKHKAIIFDLDGTLCELSDSTHPYKNDGEEIIISEMKTIFDTFFDGSTAHRIILTGRKRKDYGDITIQWLDDNGICYDKLIMQEGNTAQKNHIYKQAKLIELKQEYDIIALFDDNPDLIIVCKELGILLLQVHK